MADYQSNLEAANPSESDGRPPKKKWRPSASMTAAVAAVVSACALVYNSFPDDADRLAGLVFESLQELIVEVHENTDQVDGLSEAVSEVQKNISSLKENVSTLKDDVQDVKKTVEALKIEKANVPNETPILQMPVTIPASGQ